MATDYTADPWYDIRKLRVGGWKSSKIKVEANGQWSRFIDGETNVYINKTERIDYSKRYKPPKRSLTRSHRMEDRDSEIDNMFFAALETQRNKIFPEIAHLELTTGILNSAQQRKTKRPETTRETSVPEGRKSRIVQLDLSNVPQTARIVKQRKGQKDCGNPFRVSSSIASTRQKRGRNACSKMIVTGRTSCLET